MKKNFFLLTIFLPLFSLGANNVQVFTDTTTVGVYSVNGEKIGGKEFVFPEQIRKLFLDEKNGRLLVQTKGKNMLGKGYIIQYDIQNNEVMWSRRTSSIEVLTAFGDYLLISTPVEGKLSSHWLESKTGNELWKTRNCVYAVSIKENVGIGFCSTTCFSDKHEGIDLSNGKVVWNRRIHNESKFGYEFSNCLLNDSIMLLIGSEARIMNVKNGDLLDFEDSSACKKYGGVRSNSVGYVSGTKVGANGISDNYQLVRGIVSNGIVDSIYLYLATKEKISKINIDDGNVVWENTLPSNNASKSIILLKDGKLYMVNLGIAYGENRGLEYCGVPFIASFDMVSGENVFVTEVSTKGNSICDILLKNKLMFVLFKNRISCISLDSGQVVKDFNVDDDLKSFVKNSSYVQDSLENYNLLDTSSIVVLTKDNDYFVFDDKLGDYDVFDSSRIGIYNSTIEDYSMLVTGNVMRVVNEKSNVVATINISDDMHIYGNKIIVIRDNKCAVFDMSKLNSNY